MKSSTRGYATLDYEFAGFQEEDLVKVDILINGDPVDALAIICHRSFAEHRGRAICRRLKETIPRQMFEVRMQAAIGGRIIASTRNAPLRKDVLESATAATSPGASCLSVEPQKRMKQVGVVEVPQEAASVLRLGWVKHNRLARLGLPTCGRAGHTATGTDRHDCVASSNELWPASSPALLPGEGSKRVCPSAGR